MTDDVKAAIRKRDRETIECNFKDIIMKMRKIMDECRAVEMMIETVRVRLRELEEME